MNPLLTAAGVLTAGALAYGSLAERRWYTLRRVTVPALRVGNGALLRVLHLSDLHLAPWQQDKHKFIRACLDLAPDVVVVTGDMLGHRDATGPTVDLLGPLASGRPAVAVLGSNDFYAPIIKNPLRYFARPSRPGRARLIDADRLVEGLEGAGWLVLENASATLKTPAGPVAVAGLGDPHIRRDHPERIDWWDEATPAALRLGVVHSPYLRALSMFEEMGTDLALAGHTHGGQVRMPGVGALVTNCDLPRSQARGLSRSGELWLHVSAGLGTSIYAPIRFACRPEATLLEVIPARAPLS